MISFNRILHAILSWFSISVFFILIVDVVLGVSSRYIMGNQIRWTEELATFLLVWLVFCGSAIAYYDRAHLGINLLVESLHPSARRITRIFSLLLVLAFTSGVMVWGGGQLVMERFEAGQMMSTLGIHKAYQYLAIPFCGFFIALFNIGMLIETIQSTPNEGSSPS
jgi:TRAP-type C4-dicarboxylate transport system permease small subunit